MRLFFLHVFLLSSYLTIAQDSIRLTQNFRFENGIYTSFEDFQSNQPSIYWDLNNTELHVDKAGHLIRVSDLDTADRNDIWGICYNNVPYINLTKVIENESLTLQESAPLIFANLQSRGKLCYFYYQGYRKVKIPMTVYEPVTRRAIQTSYVENKEPVLIQKILEFETGEIVEYNLENFMALVEEDKRLWNTLNDLTPGEAREKMYKSLFIYNDRNWVFISH